MYTSLQIITEAMNDLGLLADGATPTAGQETIGLRRLNMMINSWSVNRILVHAITKENYALAVDTASYEFGTGATWNGARPNKILSPAYIRDSTGYDHKVTVIDAAQYRRIPDKSLSGRPSKLFFNPTYPNATCYVWPVPIAIENIYFDTIKPYSELANNAANCSFPVEYEEPLRTNLALRLAPVFGVSAPIEIVTIARDGIDQIMAFNASMQLEPVSSDPFGGQATYDIHED